MQDSQTTHDTRIPTTTNGHGTIYDYGVKELQHATSDETVSRRLESDFREARGHETARLHVTLKAVSEADRRGTSNNRATLATIERLANDSQERAAEIKHLIENSEETTGRRFDGVHDDIRQRADVLTAQVRSLSEAEAMHFGTLQQDAAEHYGALKQDVASFREEANAQSRQVSERITFDIRQSRDEVVSLVDSRMNQTDASFAALRGDIEVVKFLVMDLIKDRIGRHDPKSKSF